jgi:hypothetical protein
MRFDGKTSKQSAVDLKISKLSVCEKPAHELATSRIIKAATNKQANVEVTNQVDPALLDNFIKSKEGEQISTKTKHGEKEMKKEEVDVIVKEAVDTLEKRLAIAEAIAKMDDQTKAYYEGLSEKDQASFLTEPVEKQKEAVEKSKAKSQPVDDEILTTGGVEIKKSAVGADVFNFMKAQQEEVKKAQEIARIEKEKREMQDFAKQAELMFPNLPGETIKKGLVMKQLAAMPKEAMETLTAMLKSGNEALEQAKVFKEVGVAGVPVDDGSPTSRLNKMAIEKARADGIPEAQAYSEVLQTREGKDLYEKSLKQ